MAGIPVISTKLSYRLKTLWNTCANPDRHSVKKSADVSRHALNHNNGYGSASIEDPAPAAA